MPSLRFSVLLIGVLCLAACRNASPAAPAAGHMAQPELCVSTSCAEVVPLVDIPDAENLIFNEDGRLFVSGGQQVYEIERDGEAYSARPIAEASCNFTGLAIAGEVLYAACGSGPLYAGYMTPTIQLQQIYLIEDMCIPNGMEAGPDGHLYVVDEPLNINSPACLPPNPKIVRLRLDAANPMRVLAQEVWIQGAPTGALAFGADNVLRFPNGLRREQHDFYGSDGGSLYRVEWLPGGAASEVEPLFFTPTAFDDIGLVPGGILAADFFQGRILWVSRDGELLQAGEPGMLASPSSVRLARPPLFRSGDILVTEKGVLAEQNLPIDRLTLLRRRD